MKKYLSVLTVAALAACATSAFGQGILTFANNNASLVKQWGDATGSTLVNVPSGGGQVALFWGTTAYTPWTAGQSQAAFLAANPGWKMESAVGFNPLAAGRFNAGNLTLTPITTISAGVDYVVMGWTGTAGFDAALAAAGGMVNVSSKFHTAVGDGSAVPPGAPVALTGTFTGLTLQPIPEPSTFALAGLGAAALLIFRRRK